MLNYVQLNNFIFSARLLRHTCLPRLYSIRILLLELRLSSQRLLLMYFWHLSYKRSYDVRVEKGRLYRWFLFVKFWIRNILPWRWSFYYMTESLVFLQQPLLKINKMLPLFNFCIKVFARINTFKFNFTI